MNSFLFLSRLLALACRAGYCEGRRSEREEGEKKHNEANWTQKGDELKCESKDCRLHTASCLASIEIHSKIKRLRVAVAKPTTSVTISKSCNLLGKAKLM